MTRLKINREVKILSAGFSFIFFGYVSVGQYVTIFFQQNGYPSAGFISLILTYLFLMLANPFAPIFIRRFSAKNCMVVAAAVYGAFILSLLTKNPLTVYVASSLLGISAALLWVSQNSFLLRNSEEKSYGTNSGFFNSIYSLGIALGLLLISILMGKISTQTTFIIYAAFPFIGLAILRKLKKVSIKPQGNQLALIKEPFKNRSLLRLSAFYLSFTFISGLILGIIPIEIKNHIGLAYVGIISSIFFVMPIFMSYIFGRLSDLVGRKQMIILSYVTTLLGLILIYAASSSYVPKSPAYLLVAGIVLLSISVAISRPIGSALIGDVSSNKNVETITAFFWTVQNLGVTLSLVISILIQSRILYLISFAMIITSFLIIFKILNRDLREIKVELSSEID